MAEDAPIVEQDPPAVELWALVLEAALVLGGVWLASLLSGGRAGESVAVWTLTTVLLALVAGSVVPWTRGLGRGARWLLLTVGLGALGAVLTAPTLTGILLLSVIRSGMTPSWPDVWSAVSAGGPAGAFLGAAAGLGSGAILGLVVLIVEGVLGTPPNPDRPGTGRVVGMVALSALVLAGAAEAQHWAPTFQITGCSSGCHAWPVVPGGRLLGSSVGVLGLAAGAWVLDAGGRSWRGPVGGLIVPLALAFLALGHTTFTSTFGPRWGRSTLGLPPMPLPLTREVIAGEVVEHPGVLWHTVEVRWADAYAETIVLGLGPFRPDTHAFVGHMEGVAAEWRDARRPVPQGTPD